MSPSRIHADGDFGVVAKRDLGWRIPIAGKADMQRLGEAIHSAIACDTLVRNAAHSVALSVFLPKHPSRPLPSARKGSHADHRRVHDRLLHRRRADPRLSGVVGNRTSVAMPLMAVRSPRSNPAVFGQHLACPLRYASVSPDAGGKIASHQRWRRAASMAFT